MSVVISVENLSKYYRLGLIGGGTLREDVSRWWAKMRRKPDPLLVVGEESYGSRKNGEIWALQDVSFEVKEGEILGIIGRNGAGKSTLLKILSRITAPTSGCVRMRGRVGSLLEVGTGFHPELTGRENIYLNGTILGMKRSEVDRKLEEIVEFAEMGKFIDTPVKRYSSGMTVRLAFAVAAHLEPEILIVDEVLAVGDIAFQNKCLAKMQDIRAERRTVLFVSHNMNSISSLCSRCLLVNKGTIEGSGLPGPIISEYLSTTIRDKSSASFDQSTSRQGDGAIQFSSVSIVGNEASTAGIATIFYESTLSILVEVSAISRVRDVNVAVTVYDAAGARILDLNLAKVQKRLQLDSGHEAKIMFDVDQLQLSDGIYTLSLWMGVGGVTTHDTISAPISFVVADQRKAMHTEVFPGAYSPPFSVNMIHD